jgi:hypothetical protein
MKNIHSFEHYRDCPVLSQTWNELVDHTNSGDFEYGYEARRISQSEGKNLRNALAYLQQGTENCCPGKDRNFSNNELIKMGYPTKLLLGPNRYICDS